MSSLKLYRRSINLNEHKCLWGFSKCTETQSLFKNKGNGQFPT